MLIPSSARAQFQHQDDPLLLAVGAGSWDFDHHPEGELRGELRFPQSLWMIKPLVGVIGSSRGSSTSISACASTSSSPTTMSSCPTPRSAGITAAPTRISGSPVEFKTGVEFAYRFDNAARLGLVFDHISNAGFTQTNPGPSSFC